MKTGKHSRGIFVIALMALVMLSGCDLFTGPTGATGATGGIGATGPEGPSVYLINAGDATRIYSGGLVYLGSSAFSSISTFRIVNETKKTLTLATGIDAETEESRFIYSTDHYFVALTGAITLNPSSGTYSNITASDETLSATLSPGSSSAPFSITLNPNGQNYGIPHKRFRVDMTDSDGKKYNILFETFGETHSS